MSFFVKIIFFIFGISVIGLMLWFGMPNIQQALKPVKVISVTITLKNKCSVDDDSFVVTEEVLHRVFFELYSQGASLEQMVLKPNMVLTGYDASDRASTDEVANATLQCFFRSVPAAVPGIAFLSGGQSDEDATAHLNKMNQILGDNKIWNLTFSYGRALQQPALKAWQGKEENIKAAQDAFLNRAKLNGLASAGKYSTDMES